MVLDIQISNTIIILCLKGKNQEWLCKTKMTVYKLKCIKIKIQMNYARF